MIDDINETTNGLIYVIGSSSATGAVKPLSDVRMRGESKMKTCERNYMWNCRLLSLVQYELKYMAFHNNFPSKVYKEFRFCDVYELN